MRTIRGHGQTKRFRVRAGRAADLDALVDLEELTFATDRLTRRGFRRFLASAYARLKVVEHRGRLVGYAIVRFAPRAHSARLYSIAVAPHMKGRGLALALMAAVENAAIGRGRLVLRLEVHERNARAIRRYEKSGYRRFGRYTDYYEDHGDALRFEKLLAATASASCGRRGKTSARPI
jgi:ribosomal protein S18 acetylase RimI-like enzyme